MGEVLSRLTHAQLVARGYYLIAELEDRDREIEILTTERDNALLRIDQLEARVNELEEMPDSEVGRAIVADWNDARGGVNPNA